MENGKQVPTVNGNCGYYWPDGSIISQINTKVYLC